MLGFLFGTVKLICKTVFHAVWLALKIVYGVLKFFRIRLLALYVAVCAILSVFLPVFGEKIVWFWVGFGLLCAVTLFSWIDAARRALQARPRPAPEAEESGGEAAQEGTGESAERTAQPPPAPVRYPLYYDVEGRPEYFFAEYADRYELYRREAGGAVYVRTDKKYME